MWAAAHTAAAAAELELEFATLDVVARHDTRDGRETAAVTALILPWAQGQSHDDDIDTEPRSRCVPSGCCTLQHST